MSFVLGVGLPLLVVFTMFVVGLGLTRAEFAGLARRPRMAFVALAGQWLLPPVIAALLVQALSLTAVLAMGVILAAAAPAAVMSNYYALLARSNVALAVTVTAVSSLCAAVSTPAAASLGYWLAMRQSADFDLPAAKVLQQTAIGLLLPILAGMAIRLLAPGWTARHGRLLRGLALLAVVVLVVFIVTDQWALIRSHLALLLLTSALFTILMLVTGWLLGRFASAQAADRHALLFGFPARNMAVATLVAVAAFGRIDVAAFAAMFFLVQVAVLVPLALVLGRTRLAR